MEQVFASDSWTSEDEVVAVIGAGARATGAGAGVGERVGAGVEAGVGARVGAGGRVAVVAAVAAGVGAGDGARVGTGVGAAAIAPGTVDTIAAPLELAMSLPVGVASLPPPQACTARVKAASDQRHLPAVEWMSLIVMPASLSTAELPL